MVTVHNGGLSRRGFALSITTLLLALLVLSLVVIIFRSSLESRERIEHADALRVLAEEDTSLHEVLRTLFAHSGITVSLTNESILFSETIPNPNASAWQSLVDDFETFVSARSSSTLDLNVLRNELPLLIRNYNTTYTHDSFGDDVRVVLDDSISSVSLSFIVPANVTDCDFTTSPGIFNVSVHVDGTFGTSCDETAQVDIDQFSQLEIDTFANLTILNGTLFFSHVYGDAVLATTTLHFGSDFGMPRLYYGGHFVNSTNVLGAKRSSLIRIR